MKSDDDSNTLDEKTDYSSGLYETILSWEQHSGLQLVHSVFHDMIPIRSVRDRESGSV